MGVDPYLQQVQFSTRVRCLTGFAAQKRTDFYGYGQQVQSSTVTGAITVIGQTIALACNKNPTKGLGSEKFLPALQIMLDGYKETPGGSRCTQTPSQDGLWENRLHSNTGVRIPFLDCVLLPPTGWVIHCQTQAGSSATSKEINGSI